MKTNPEIFQEQKYVYVPNAVSKDICQIAAQYGLFDSVVNFTPDTHQVVGAHAKYADPLMESLLLYVLPIVEKNTGLKLFPTYSFYRTYRPGDKLDHHKDRPSCEISLSLCLGFNYGDSLEPDYRWALNVGDSEFKMEVGDIAIYRGLEVDHWRDELKGDKETWQVQAFLHYVNAEDKYWPLKYDTRPSLGVPPEYKNHTLLTSANSISEQNYEIPQIFNIIREK